MAISPAVLQRRHWGDGRIRIGARTTNAKGTTFPTKLTTFRLTSPSEEMIRAAAELYGGQVRPWESPEGPQFEVVTAATRLPVLIPPKALSQHMEAWSAAQCIRRCDGETIEQISGQPCLCAAQRNRICKPTTRLSVLLKEVPSLGMWRLDSHGWNAAAELPDAADFLSLAGQYAEGVLFLRKKQGFANGKPTSYMVPGLTVEGLTPAELLSGEVQSKYAIGGAAQQKAELASGTAKQDRPDYVELANQAETADDVRNLYTWAKDAGHLNADLAAQLAQIGSTKPGAKKPEAAQDPEGDSLRQQIIAAWPSSTSELHERFKEATGTTMKLADIGVLTTFLSVLREPPEADEEEIPEADVVDEEPVDADIVEDEAQAVPPTPASEQNVPMADDDQLRKMGILFTECSITAHTGKGMKALNDAARFAWLRDHLGRDVQSTKDLTHDEATGVIEALAQHQIEVKRKRASLYKQINESFNRLGITEAEDRFRDLSDVLGRMVEKADDLTDDEVWSVAELLEMAVSGEGRITWDAMHAAAKKVTAEASA